MVEGLAGSRPEEEWLTKPERREKSNACIGYRVSVDCRPRTRLVPEGKVGLVQIALAQRRDQVEIESLNMCRAFHAISCRAVVSHVEGLIRISRIVKVIGHEELILRIDSVINATKEGAIVNNEVDWLTIVFIEVALHKVK